MILDDRHGKDMRQIRPEPGAGNAIVHLPPIAFNEPRLHSFDVPQRTTSRILPYWSTLVAYEDQVTRGQALSRSQVDKGCDA